MTRRWLCVLTIASLLPLSSHAAPARSLRPDEVQIIAQWSTPMTRPAKGYPFDLLSVFDMTQGCIPAEQAISRQAGELYFDDGNDVGGGKCNVYLYTDKPNETVARLAAMESAGLLPSGIRVGVARYKNSTHTDWTYAPAYPANLKRFDQ
jgi:hypothetical protein